MIESAKNWAERKGMAGKTDSKDADAQDLPFDEGSFDILICESVNIFVPDKVKAFTEYKRVVKPGGVVGLNEPVLTKTAPANAGELLADFVGHDILPVSYWMDLLEETGFINIILSEYLVEMREESRSQMGFFTAGDFVRLVGNMLKAIFGRNPFARDLIRRSWSNSRES